MRFAPLRRMSQVNPPNATSTTTPKFDEDAVFALLSDPMRQGIVAKLAKGENKTAKELGSGTGLKRPAFQRYLASMCNGGILVQKDNPKDRRQCLYMLSPAAVLCETNGFTSVDFDCYMLRFPKA